ncbi:acetyl-coenzyme A transporter 1-like protein, partial [Leptotrombidium deliense]
MEDVVEKVRRDSLFIDYTTNAKKEVKGLRGDYGNIFLLVFLYILQGIPLGIMATIPMMLASNHVSYDNQAIFTFARYPYVLKLLWAPIVDSLYSKRF